MGLPRNHLPNRGKGFIACLEILFLEIKFSICVIYLCNLSCV